MSRFFKIKSIPKLFWSSPHPLTLRPPIKSVIFLFLGLIIFGFGEALLIASSAGVSPWTVFAQGISNVTGWSVGFATFAVGCAVLFLWIPLKQKPGIGTILNIIIISTTIDLLIPILPTFEHPVLRAFEASFGVIAVGFGSAIYLIANLGPGPRDGLMTGVQELTALPLATVRGSIEVSIVFLGWLLGGIVGFGTLMFAFGIGPCVAGFMYLMSRLVAENCAKTGKKFMQ